MSSMVKRKVKINPDWYRVEAAQTLPSGGAVTINMSNLLKVLSDAKKLGKRPSVHAISVTVNYSGTYGVASAGKDWKSAQVQRGCFLTADFDQPNVSAKFSTKSLTLSQFHEIGRIVNPVAQSLDRTLPAKKRASQRFDTGDAPLSILYVPNSDVDKRISLIDGWGNDENWQVISDAVGGGSFDFVDTFTIPMCSFSGPKSFLNDKLPLAMICDPNSPWRLTITERTIGGKSVRTGHIQPDAGGTTITIAVYVFVSFADVDSDHRVGVQWASTPNPFSNSDKILDPHYYRCFAMMPDYSNVQTDGGGTIATPYAPDNWQAVLANANVRLFDCSEQKFPLDSYSEAWRTVEHFNIGNNAGENARLCWDTGASTTIQKGTGSSLAGDTSAVYGSETLGQFSQFPLFPLLTNHFAVDGFPVNLMSKPNCSADMRVQIDGASLPTNASSRAMSIYIAEYDGDRDTAKQYSVNGKQTGDFGSTKWTPELDNLNSPYANENKDIVPHVLRV